MYVDCIHISGLTVYLRTKSGGHLVAQKRGFRPSVVFPRGYVLGVFCPTGFSPTTDEEGVSDLVGFDRGFGPDTCLHGLWFGVFNRVQRSLQCERGFTPTTVSGSHLEKVSNLYL